MTACIDANGRVGSVPGSGIGTCQPATETENGAMFRQFLDEYSLYAVSTYFNAGHTWVSGHGGGRRIDYVVTCARLYKHIIRSHTDSSIELGTTAKIDHYLFAGEFEARLEGNPRQGGPPRHRPYSININATRVPQIWMVYCMILVITHGRLPQRHLALPATHPGRSGLVTALGKCCSMSRP